ncbi:voltage-dependent T-type calcium channel subunit alpha-1H-like [Menidia menidia]
MWVFDAGDEQLLFVALSLCDVAGVFDTGLPAMRALRMMRFGRLVNNFPYLKRQLMLLCRTLGKVFTLCLLMVLFVFAFGVMGMYLFGCRYDARHNFDSLTWSMVTIFQLLTQEDWNLVLYNAISSTSGWAAVYFVVTSMIGNNILLNVLMSIVVDSFQSAPPIETSTESDIQGPTESTHIGRDVSASRKRNPFQRFLNFFQKPLQWCREHKEWAFFLVPPHNRFRMLCKKLVEHKYFDWSIMLFILIGCITNAFERPAILADSTERQVLDIFSDVLVAIFSVEMVMKVTAKGFVYGEDNYCKSFWNILDGFLVISSLGNLLFKAGESGESRMFSLIKVLRLLRALRPLRVIKRVPKLKLAVEALVSSVKPMANIILISCVFLFFFGIVGVQLFKGQFSYCVGEDTSMIVNKSDCLAANYQWVQNTFNFDNLPQALLTLFVMYSKDGWLIVMYDGLDAVDVDQQPQKNYNQWLLTYFILFMVMSLFLLDMFIGVMVETFHQCHRAQKQEDHGQQHDSTPSTQNAVAPIEEKSAPTHCYIVKLSTSRVWDNVVTIIVSCNMLVMIFEHHGQPKYLTMLGDCAHYVFTLFLGAKVLLMLVAFGWKKFRVDSWNMLDMDILIVSIISAVFTLLNTARKVTFSLKALRVCHILRLAKVLKDEKIKVLIRTITKTLSQVGHICLLFFFLFFIFAVLGVELFGKLACTPEYPCFGINRYTHFKNFPMALLTLYAVCTGDNWNGILKDTLRECRPDDDDCSSYLRWASPLYFITFVIVAQFVLANLVVAAIVQALEDSTKEVSSDINRAEGLKPPEADSECHQV